MNATTLLFFFNVPATTEICTLSLHAALPTSAWAAGTHAVANAARLIAPGRCDVVLAGGSEAAFVETAIAGFTNMTAFSSLGISRPFDAERDGFVMGEGAGILVLEDWEMARARGATILAEILGGASTADAHHITAPSPAAGGPSPAWKWPSRRRVYLQGRSVT